MRQILLVIFIILSKFAVSQTITADFPDSNYYYNESRNERGSDMTPYNTIDYTIYYKKDTVVNSLNYHLLYIKFTIEYMNLSTPKTIGDIRYALLRNDKANKKVYIKGLANLSFNLNLDTNEQLYYDFNLKVGDIYTARPKTFYTSDTLFVNRIDTIIDPDNIKRAVYTISTRNNTDEMLNGYIIQGIGGYNGLIGYISFIWNNFYGEYFSCYNFNGIGYTANFGSFTSINYNTCNKHIFSSVITPKSQVIKLYPNPASNIIQFDLDEKINTIKIYNSLGQIISNYSSTDQFINIENYLQGIYFVQIIIDHKIYTGTFIKQ